VRPCTHASRGARPETLELSLRSPLRVPVSQSPRGHTAAFDDLDPFLDPVSGRKRRLSSLGQAEQLLPTASLGGYTRQLDDGVKIIERQPAILGDPNEGPEGAIRHVD
jgi:hypothetical protein